ncbi:hypothetical protein C723_3148 [Christiangramia flava JLT2011]|uniref:Uncharacterized protein n=1 Tax=Christiangramia flava JLT2011 TaxID=1229726 RepID=A0A1L7I7D9_9FLAO|nr:hypothetical protein GRFL_2804 [Christiangramia flava JLT2011]OSS37869.1 hypothetical protein C723_3148 [Christiangramia flava JLT2011]|tara:strand:+ start:461 stop:643 length:183 start_codon:yes stop_codon:yes gene_type:complete
MENKKIQLLQLSSIGLLLIALSQIIWHFFEIPDFYNGIFMGIGIGLMLFALMKRRKIKTS